MLTTRNGTAVLDTKARYWSKITIFSPVRGSPSEYRHNIWYSYPMVKKLKICFFVSTEYMNVTHGQTDTARRHMPRLCLLA